MIEFTTWQFVIVLVLFIWRNSVHPQLPNITPAEILDAAKNVSSAAAKWGQLADTLNGALSWHLPAVLVIGIVVGVLVVRLWRGNPS